MSVVADFSTRNVTTCNAHDSAERAAQLMWDNDTGFLPVVDDDDIVVGAVTDRDLCMAAYTQGKSLAQIEVRSAASLGVVTVRGTDSVDSVEALMRKYRIRRVPVVDLEGHPTGVLSVADLARHMHRTSDGDGLGPATLVETLAVISSAPATDDA